MKKLLCGMMALLLVFTICHSGVMAAATEYRPIDSDASAGEMVVDAVIARPAGLVTTLLGLVCFVVTYPFAYAGDNVEESYRVLVQEPAVYTFDRPLGHLKEGK